MKRVYKHLQCMEWSCTILIHFHFIVNNENLNFDIVCFIDIYSTFEKMSWNNGRRLLGVGL